MEFTFLWGKKDKYVNKSTRCFQLMTRMTFQSYVRPHHLFRVLTSTSVLELAGQKRVPLFGRFSFSVIWAVISFAPPAFLLLSLLLVL